MEYIDADEQLIASLLSLNCITEERSRFIQRQRSKLGKNAELLKAMKNIDETAFSNFAKCLRQINQKTVAAITENGGGL